MPYAIDQYVIIGIYSAGALLVGVLIGYGLAWGSDRIAHGKREARLPDSTETDRALSEAQTPAEWNAIADGSDKGRSRDPQ